MDNKTVIKALEEIALLLELKGANQFKTRAYRNGARTLQTIDESVETLVTEERLGDLKGFGDALVSKISELVETGEMTYLNELRSEFPDTLSDLLDLSGLGPKKVKLFYDELGIASIDALEKACNDGSVAALKGCGEKTAAKLLEAIEHKRKFASQFLYLDVREAADEILAHLAPLDEVKEIEVAGSLRRFKESTKDVDILAASEQPEAVMDTFVNMESVESIIGQGETKSSVRLKSGLQVDLRIVDPASFPFALHHFTGSKDHNVEMRSRAIKRDMKLSEWGLYDENGDILPCNNETELFEKLGLHYIPPELREGRGEIDWAEEHEAPDLVNLDDYKGVLHCHSHASDGNNSIEELVDHARDQGHRYIGITDHSVSQFQANGLDADRLLEQIDKIEAIRKDLTDITLFSSVECDIKVDGTLDYEDSILEKLDYVIVSVHSGFNRSRDEQTSRIIKAIEHPASRILAHPTGRLLLKREPYDIDLPKIIDAAIANNVALEFNCSPQRLDLDWRHWRSAKEKGLLCSLNPDAHNLPGFDYLKFGIGFCRKGWLTADDIINCWDLQKLKSFFAGDSD